MSNGLENLKKMVYPGRMIIIGKSPDGHTVVMYAITGRSPSSQARKLEVDEAKKGIFVKPTDEETLKKGNPDLLVYPAIMWNRGIAVSNGKQTEDVFTHLSPATGPVEILVKALASWQYEPDEPNFTPRISGCITQGAGLNILKRAQDGSVMRNSFEIPLIAGKGKMITTYTGINENPLPSFAGEPQDVDVSWSTAEDAAAALYDALGPLPGEPDFRVTAAVVFAAPDGTITKSITNRNN